MLHCVFRAGLAEMRHMRGSWESLHGGASLWGRYEWHLAVASHLIDEGSVAYLQVMNGERTIAILPLLRTKVPLTPFGTVAAQTLGHHPLLSLTDFPMCPEADAVAVAAAAWDALTTLPHAWRFMYWHRVPKSGNAMRLASAWPKHQVFIRDAAPCNTLPTSQAYEDMQGLFSKNLKASLRKSEQRLNEAGPWAVSTQSVGDSNEIPARFDAFLTLEASGWKGAAGTGSAIALNTDARDFFAALLACISGGFDPQIALLYLKEKPIAAQFSILVNGTRHILKIGYDEATSKYSPGQVLMAAVLKEACSSAVGCVSLVTNMPWHATWRPVGEPTCSVLVFRSRSTAFFYSIYLRLRRLLKQIHHAVRKAMPLKSV